MKINIICYCVKPVDCLYPLHMRQFFYTRHKALQKPLVLTETYLQRMYRRQDNIFNTIEITSEVIYSQRIKSGYRVRQESV